MTILLYLSVRVPHKNITYSCIIITIFFIRPSPTLSSVSLRFPVRSLISHKNNNNNNNSGLLHQLAQMALAQLVSLCWAKSGMLRFIQAMKFLELVGGNMLAITNLAICVNLALIVSVRFGFLLLLFDTTYTTVFFVACVLLLLLYLL